MRFDMDGRLGGAWFHFGCEIQYKATQPNRKQLSAKFAPKNRTALMVGYAQHGSYLTMDLADYLGGVVRKLVCTDVVATLPPRYPISKALADQQLDWQFFLDMDDLEIACPECKKWRTSVDISCKICLGIYDDAYDDKKTKRRPVKPKTPDHRHVDGPGCKRNRCTCKPSKHDRDDDDNIDEHDSGGAEVHHVAEDDNPGDGSLHGLDELATEIMARALVTRSISLQSAEARTPEARAAVDKELNNLTSLMGVWSWDDTLERDLAKTMYPDAVFVRLHLLLGQKFAETNADASSHYKARCVALGNQLRDGCGKPATLDSFEQVVPISLETGRLIDAYGGMVGVVEVADIDCAYLQAPLRGKMVFLEFPRNLVPEKYSGLRRPVAQAHKAIYGLDRSGSDWNSKLTEELLKRGWTCDRDVDKSVFSKTFPQEVRPAVLGCYVDDLKLAAPKSIKALAWKDASESFVISRAPHVIDKYLGIDHKVTTHDYGTMITYSQREYAQTLVARFLEDTGLVKLRRRSTPGRWTNDFLNEENQLPGKWGAIAPVHLGGAMYLARGSRTDILFATGFLQRYVSCWCIWCDQLLGHLMGYIMDTTEIQGVSKFMHADIGKLWLELFTDSDHGGDPGTARSTSGAILMLRGAHGTTAFLGAFSRRQGAVAHSTAEAEVLALNEGCRKLLFPTIALAERFFGKMGGKVLTDASAARGALENCGQNMKYITKTQRISLSWLRDALAGDGITVEPVHTSVNIADACTKHLQQPRLAELCRLFGLGKPQAAVD